jgi:hypothetical protein
MQMSEPAAMTPPIPSPVFVSEVRASRETTPTKRPMAVIIIPALDIFSAVALICLQRASKFSTTAISAFDEVRGMKVMDGSFGSEPAK